MTKEDKKLLLKDLCGRLPYGAYVFVHGFSPKEILKTKHIDAVMDDYDIKPYLRPMSNMTEEEKKEYKDLLYCVKYAVDTVLAINMLTDWFNTHHFDYNGLIKKGLAIAVTEENNPYKE